MNTNQPYHDFFWEPLISQIENGTIVPVIGDEFNLCCHNEINLPRYLCNSPYFRSKDYYSIKEILCFYLIDLFKPELENKQIDFYTVCSSILKHYDPLQLQETLHKQYTTLCSTLSPAIDLSQHFSKFRINQFLWASPFIEFIFPKKQTDDVFPFTLPIAPRNMDKAAKTKHFALWGNACNEPFAITNENRLDYLCALPLSGIKYWDILKKSIEGKNLLLIGTDFPVWLFRFFVGILSGIIYKKTDNVKIITDESLFDKKLSIAVSENYRMKFLLPNMEYFGSQQVFMEELSKRLA